MGYKRYLHCFSGILRGRFTEHIPTRRILSERSGILRIIHSPKFSIHIEAHILKGRSDCKRTCRIILRKHRFDCHSFSRLHLISSRNLNLLFRAVLFFPEEAPLIIQLLRRRLSLSLRWADQLHQNISTKNTCHDQIKDHGLISFYFIFLQNAFSCSFLFRFPSTGHFLPL